MVVRPIAGRSLPPAGSDSSKNVSPVRCPGGFSLVEMLIATAIFSVIIAGVFGAYISQMKVSGREYKLAQAEIENTISRNLIERDIFMAGFGLANDYDGLFAPRPVQASEAGNATDWDTLTLMGTALGLQSRQAQAWTYFQDNAPTFKAAWEDPRENLATNDRVILINPISKRLIVEGGNWLFKFDRTADPDYRLTAVADGASLVDRQRGMMVYGLHGSTATVATQPFYAVKYYRSSTANPPGCAAGTRDLLRAESRTSADPGGGDQVLACVRDFQVAFGLDTDEDGTVDTWNNGITTAASYTLAALQKRLLQVRAYALVQTATPEGGYQYPTDTVRVGETDLGTGRNITLTEEQRRYRWKLLTFSVVPRNIR